MICGKESSSAAKTKEGRTAVFACVGRHCGEKVPMRWHKSSEEGVFVLWHSMALWPQSSTGKSHWQEDDVLTVCSKSKPCQLPNEEEFHRLWCSTGSCDYQRKQKPKTSWLLHFISFTGAIGYVLKNPSQLVCKSKIKQDIESQLGPKCQASLWSSKLTALWKNLHPRGRGNFESLSNFYIMASSTTGT